VVAVEVPHHVTQRGNGRGFILDCDADRAVYLNLLRENIALYGVALIGYCLMSNHVHLIAVPRKADGLAQALKQTHGRYASYWNAAHQSSGDLWSDGTGTLLKVVNWPPFFRGSTEARTPRKDSRRPKAT
jgi:putative transposase